MFLAWPWLTSIHWLTVYQNKHICEVARVNIPNPQLSLSLGALIMGRLSQEDKLAELGIHKANNILSLLCISINTFFFFFFFG